MKRAALCCALMLSLLLLGGVQSNRVALLGGQILTMDSENRRAQAMLIENDRIIAIGTDEQIQSRISGATLVVDLAGETVIPGFVDAHSHFPSSGLVTLGLDLAPPPVGSIDSVDGLLQRIAESVAVHDDGDWIIGFNYDDAALQPSRHPVRQELDRVAPENPVYLWHRSGHMGVANSAALVAFGLSDSSMSVPGGRLGRAADGSLDGLLQERAAPPMADLLRRIPRRKLPNVLFHARDEYLAAGVTTVQNGYADRLTARLLQLAQWLRIVPQRVLVWPSHDKWRDATTSPRENMSLDSHDGSLQAESRSSWNSRRKWFYKGAVKLIVDGSPQGQTAWLLEPYKTLPTHGHPAGFPAMSSAELQRLVLDYHKQGIQLAVHGNGSAAIDAIISAFEDAQRQTPRLDLRHILVHAQILRQDQLQRLHAVDVGVSFFPTHTYYWGDWYRQRLLGEERAANISPLAWAVHSGVRFSLHTDAPVTPMRPMEVIWSATERRTLSDKVLGPAQKISRLQALRALTIDAAWQNHLDHDRGSLEIGKLADLVILSGDPLTIGDVRQIYAQSVYIGGVGVYQRKP